MGGSEDLAPDEEREAERRKAHLGNGRGLFPGLPGKRGTRQRLSASRRGVLNPWSALPGTWLTAISRRPPVPVQPASVADPDSGAGRIPRASRERKSYVSPPPSGAASRPALQASRQR